MPEEYGQLHTLKTKEGQLVKVSCTETQLKNHWIKKLGYSLVDPNEKAVTNDVATDSGVSTTQG